MSKIILTKTQQDKVWHIKLNHPEKLNVLGEAMLAQLTKVFQEAAKDSIIQTLILSGEGKSFCAGGDLSWLLLNDDASDIENINEVNHLFQMFNTLASLSIPTIAYIHGSVYGGGIGLTAACDIVIAEEDTEFCFSELKLGLMPSVISPFVLRKMSFSKAQALMLSAEKFSVEGCGNLVHFFGSKEKCKEYVKNLADRFSQFDKQAVQETKILIQKVFGTSPEESKNYCVESLAKRRKQPYVKEKIKKFLKLKSQ